ncbi:MAG: hypothetical protein JRE58_09720, partial [Deltaproteobacteria bacterium]|nr:hypothetical protein [Deltaproteobacteria bacterium]
MEEKNNAVNFSIFASKRIIVGIVLLIAVLWILGTMLGFYDKSPEIKSTDSHGTDIMHSADVQHTEVPAKDTRIVKPQAAVNAETKPEAMPYAEKTRELTQTESKPEATSPVDGTQPQKDHTPTHAAEKKAPETHTAARGN